MSDKPVHVTITIEADVVPVFLDNMFEAVKNITPDTGRLSFEVDGGR